MLFHAYQPLWSVGIDIRVDGLFSNHVAVQSACSLLLSPLGGTLARSEAAPVPVPACWFWSCCSVSLRLRIARPLLWLALTLNPRTWPARRGIFINHICDEISQPATKPANLLPLLFLLPDIIPSDQQRLLSRICRLPLLSFRTLHLLCTEILPTILKRPRFRIQVRFMQHTPY